MSISLAYIPCRAFVTETNQCKNSGESQSLGKCCILFVSVGSVPSFNFPLTYRFGLAFIEDCCRIVI